MATDGKRLYKALAQNPQVLSTESRRRPEAKVEEEVADIFAQARRHRNLLVWFYVGYTAAVTLVVFGLLIAQAVVRVSRGDGGFEIVPQWALNLLVAGMFGQFVGLLAIVTKRVWNFGDFFKHHNEIMSGGGLPPKKPDEPAEP